MLRGVLVHSTSHLPHQHNFRRLFLSGHCFASFTVQIGPERVILITLLTGVQVCVSTSLATTLTKTPVNHHGGPEMLELSK